MSWFLHDLLLLLVQFHFFRVLVYAQLYDLMTLLNTLNDSFKISFMIH